MGIFNRKGDEQVDPIEPIGTPEEAEALLPPELVAALAAQPEAGTSAQDHYAALKGFLDTTDWEYTEAEDRPVVWAGFTSNHGEWRLYMAVAEDGVVQVDSVLSQRVPEDRRVEMAHFLTLANYGLRLGGFQFDFTDGELRFHTSVDVEGTVLGEKMLRNLIFANLATMDRHYRAIMTVSYGNIAGLVAYQQMTQEIVGD